MGWEAVWETVHQGSDGPGFLSVILLGASLSS